MHDPSSSAVSHVGWQRGFWSLMVTQFQNAFSDNALKQLIIFVLLAGAAATAASAGAAASAVSAADAATAASAADDRLVSLVTAVFSAPFILFAMLGGWLADRNSKQRMMVYVKTAEMGIMAFAGLALWLKSLPLLLGAIFLMGCHSAIFAPSKYGILPEILPHDKLSWGNGILELLTFLGVILGVVAAGIFSDAFGTRTITMMETNGLYRIGQTFTGTGIPEGAIITAVTPTSITIKIGLEWIAGPILMAIAFVGWLFSRKVTPVPAADPTCPVRINPVTDLWRQLRIMKQDRDLWRACWGNTGFYFISALVMMNMVVFCKKVLNLTDLQNSMMNVWLAVGIGIGSVVAGYASRGRIEYRLVPLGALGLALSTIPMGMEGVTADTFRICMGTLGFSAGLFIVPVVSVIQHRPSPESKGAVQGSVSSLSFLGIMAAAGVQWIARETFHISSAQVFWVCGASALICGAYAAISRGRFIEVE
jgi:acyl-[acyl-carrier-protein]-phospholipid O-acyltransferase/long-chain-fatty-acid--[acyl-carrier-protein] ligase